jgi:hypothetical protein
MKAIEDCERAVELLEQSASGERWRSYWALAQALDQLPEVDAVGVERKVELLRRAVRELSLMRDQIPEEDVDRRAGVTRARSGPARDLSRVLQATDPERAAAVAREWSLDEPVNPLK